MTTNAPPSTRRVSPLSIVLLAVGGLVGAWGAPVLYGLTMNDCGGMNRRLSFAPPGLRCTAPNGAGSVQQPWSAAFPEGVVLVLLGALVGLLVAAVALLRSRAALHRRSATL